MICHHFKSKKIFLDEKVFLYQCHKCHLIFQKILKKQPKPKNVYEQYYKNEISTRFHFGLEHLVKLFRFFRAFKLFTIYPKAKSILDIGSGRGWTLYFLKKYYRYRIAIGTQLCQNAVDFSRKKLGLTIYNKDLLKIDFANQKFDFITMWHVLEHVTHPEEYIQKIYQLLAPNGMFLVEVPNYNSWTRVITDKYWLGLDLKYHLSFFNKDSLVEMLEKHHFEILNIHTFSFEYSVFISTSSFVSYITKTDHLFFEWLQTKEKRPRIFWHALLFLCLFPIFLAINILLYFSSSGEVLLISARKRN